MDIQNFTSALHEEDGIYVTERQTEISYPEDWNEHCFQIEENSFWFAHRNNCIIEAVKKYSPDALFFDIGGGNGFVAKGLQAQGIESVLVEPGMAGALNAKKRGLPLVICSTLEDAQFQPNSLPAAGLFDVVEHIEDDLKFMQSIHHYLQENGLVYITVPAYKMLWSNEDVDAGHYRRYTLRSMRRLLEQAGFEVTYNSYIFSILPLAVFLFRTIPSKLGFNKKSGEVKKHKNEHARKKGWISSILDRIWRWELRRIQKGKRVVMGGSCFVVARKK